MTITLTDEEATAMRADIERRIRFALEPLFEELYRWRADKQLGRDANDDKLIQVIDGLDARMNELIVADEE